MTLITSAEISLPKRQRRALPLVVQVRVSFRLLRLAGHRAKITTWVTYVNVLMASKHMIIYANFGSKSDFLKTPDHRTLLATARGWMPQQQRPVFVPVMLLQAWARCFKVEVYIHS